MRQTQRSSSDLSNIYFINISFLVTALHEDAERLERLIVKDFKQDTKTHREKLMQSQRVRKRLDQIQESAKKLVSLRSTWPNTAK